MRLNRTNAVLLAAIALCGAFGPLAMAQAPSPPPDQGGAVQPSRATTPTSSAPIDGKAAAQSRAVVPAPGSPLPGQTRGEARSSYVAPTMPPLTGGVVPALKSPAELAVDDTLPAGIEAQVRELKRRMDLVQRAAAASAGTQPRPVTRSQPITQAAGEEPPSIRTSMGIPTSLVFTDSTGASWPVEQAVPGDSAQFDVLEGTSNVQVRPKTPYAYGGLTITLKGNDVPVAVILTTAQREVDSRVDIRVLQRGPNASAPIVDRLVTGTSAPSDAALISFLDGVAPSGSREVVTSMRGVRAWSFNDQLYLRTDMTLVSPLWTDSVSSPNGLTRTYLLSSVPSIVVSSEGRMVAVSIGE